MMNPQIARSTKGTGAYVAGVFECIFGGMLTLGFGIALIVVIALQDAPAVVVPVLLAFFAIGAALLCHGLPKCQLYQFGTHVRNLLQDKQWEHLSVLSQATRKDYTALVRDLRALVAKGIFPGAYVDLNRKEFVLSSAVQRPPAPPSDVKFTEKRRKSAAPIYAFATAFLLYALIFPLYRWFDFLIAGVASLLIALLVGRFAPERTIILEERCKAEPPKPPKPPEKINTGNEELDEVLTKAMTYMSELTALDVAITNEHIDSAVQELVHICTQIFDHVKKEPEKVRQIRQFMNYYLPTTIGLLRNYDELSRARVKGENIQQSMTKIESTVESIRKAFRKKLDDLYQDKAMDISVDIEVLQNMMEEEGITGGMYETVSPPSK